MSFDRLHFAAARQARCEVNSTQDPRDAGHQISSLQGKPLLVFVRLGFACDAARSSARPGSSPMSPSDTKVPERIGEKIVRKHGAFFLVPIVRSHARLR